MDNNDDSEPLLVDDGGDDDEGGAPPSLLCPITQEVMVEPVIASDGFTYERSAIERWLDMGPDRRSPTTNAPLPSRTLVPNRHLASASPGASHETGARPSAQGHHRRAGFSGPEEPARFSPDALGERASPVASATRTTPDASGIAREGNESISGPGRLRTSLIWQVGKSVNP